MNNVKYNPLADQPIFYHYQKIGWRMHLKPGDPLSIIHKANNPLSTMPYVQMTSNLVNEAIALVLDNGGAFTKT
jgi:hypothetical protein